jgi:hypothetical protein
VTGRQWFAHATVAVAFVIVLLGVFGVLDMREQSYLDQLEPVAVADTAAPVPAGTPSTAPSPAVQTATPPTSTRVVEVVAVLDVPADPLVERGESIPGEPLPLLGLHGLPFAPAELTGCDEMAFYRAQAGLIPHFDHVGKGESRCRNTVSSWCCHGYWQIHQDFWFPMPECDVVTVDDLLGDTPIEKQRNACAARVVYETQGGSAWDAW